MIAAIEIPDDKLTPNIIVAFASINNRIQNLLLGQAGVSLGGSRLSEADDKIHVISLTLRFGSGPSATITVRISKSDLERAANDDAIVDRLAAMIGAKVKMCFARIYYRDYEVAFEHWFDRDAVTILRAAEGNKCRFCDRESPIVSFNNDAHAIPESTGNRTLFTKYECDECNHEFGRGSGIEGHFGRWSNLHRSILSVEGKTGLPDMAMKGGYIKVLPDQTEIKIPHASLVRFTTENRECHLTLTSPTYIPVAVIKAFNKMALTVMPEAELENFKHLVQWLKNPDHSVPPSGQFTGLTATFGPNDSEGGYCLLLRRRVNDGAKPAMTFVLSFGQSRYQIFLADRQQSLGGSINAAPFCNLSDEFARRDTTLLDMSSGSERRGEQSAITLTVLGEIVKHGWPSKQ